MDASLLLQTALELENRSAIEDLLREMVDDVAAAHGLEEQLVIRAERDAYKDRVTSYELALAENRAAQEWEAAERNRLADQFVQECAGLSETIGRLRATEKEHAELCQRHDQVVATLVQTQEDLEQARAQRDQQQQQQNGQHHQTPAPATATSTVGTPKRDESSAGNEKKDPAVSNTENAPASATEVTERLPPTPEHVAIDEKDQQPGDSSVTPSPKDGNDETRDRVKSSAVDTTESIVAQEQQASIAPTALAVTPTSAPATSSDPVPPPTVQRENYGGTTVALPPLKKEESKNDAVTSPPGEEPAAAATTEPAVTVSLEDDPEPTVGLEEFDTKILMIIFAYLDALDILNTAQVNVSMYSRVDSLFGLGGAGGEEDNSTIATFETGGGHANSSTAANSQLPPPAAASVTTTAASTATTTTAPTLASTTGTVVAIPPATAPVTLTPTTPHTATHRRTESTPTSTAADGIRGLFSTFSSLTQNNFKAPGALQSLANTPVRAVQRNSSGNSVTNYSLQSTHPQHHQQQQQHQHQPPMNAAMANSLAAKLTDPELNAIILMSDRLRRKEEQAAKLSRERDEMAAKLQEVEDVKQYLLSKVGGMESSLASRQAEESKVALQVASDQEVIAFLDGRVQILERGAGQFEKERKTMLQEMARVREQAEQKSLVMGDMLQFERDRYAESERDWKSTRKLLVKEVRHCRAQIAILQAERDGFRKKYESVVRNDFFPSARGETEMKS